MLIVCGRLINVIMEVFVDHHLHLQALRTVLRVLGLLVQSQQTHALPVFLPLGIYSLFCVTVFCGACGGGLHT